MLIVYTIVHTAQCLFSLFFFSFFCLSFCLSFDVYCLRLLQLPSHYIRKASPPLFSCFVVLISRFMCLQVCNIGWFFFWYIYFFHCTFFLVCYFDVFFSCSSFLSLSLSLSLALRVIQCTSISFSCTALRVPHYIIFACLPLPVSSDFCYFYTTELSL